MLLEAVKERQAYLRWVIEHLQCQRDIDIHGTASSSSSSSNNDIPPLKDGSTAMYIAAERGNASQVKLLAQLGEDINSANEYGWTPVIVAACNDQGTIIEILSDFGADLNVTDINHDSAVTIAAHNGCISAIRMLAQYGADIDMPDGKGHSPMMTAFMATGKEDATVELMRLGASPAQLATEMIQSGISHLHPAITEYHDMFCRGLKVTQSCGLNVVSDETHKNAMFSIAKLMTSVTRSEAFSCVIKKNIFESSLISHFLSEIPPENLTHMFQIAYPLKRKLCVLAAQVFDESLKVDGDRISQSTKVYRYTDIVRFMFDKPMLLDILSLRATCKSNCIHRRFPVFSGRTYRELETNLIESFMAYDSCRFVPLRYVHLAIRILP
jgi:hypothetical protein